MKKAMILVLGVIFSAGSVQAAEPVDFFGAIFNIIENQINKDKPGSANANKKVILKETENKIVLGRVFLTPNKTVDTVNLPNCTKGTGNKRVTRLRLVVAGADVYVDIFRVKYHNGATETFAVNQGFNDGETSKWFNLKGDARCVVAAAARGQVVVKNGKPGFNISIGSDGSSFNFGTGNTNTRAVVNFVGLKADTFVIN